MVDLGVLVGSERIAVPIDAHVLRERGGQGAGYQCTRARDDDQCEERHQGDLDAAGERLGPARPLARR
jgi:hypothetical protein